MTDASGDTTGRGEALRFATLIGEQAQDEVQSELAAARARAERITKTADDEAAEVRAQAQRDGAERGRRRSARLLAATESALHREWLQAREALIDAVIGEALAALADLPQWPNATGVLGGLVKEALSQLPPGRVRVRLPADWLALVDQIDLARFAGDRWQVDFETGDVPGGGVIATSSDGRLQFDNSFEARLRRLRAPLRRKIAGFLFGR